MPKYRLRRKFFDGKILHPVDTILDFEEGAQPSSATLWDGKVSPPAEPAPEPELEPELDLVDAGEGDTLSGLSKGKKK